MCPGAVVWAHGCLHVCTANNRDKDLKESGSLVMLCLLPDVISSKICLLSNKPAINADCKVLLVPMEEVAFETSFPLPLKDPDSLHNSH